MNEGIQPTTLVPISGDVVACLQPQVSSERLTRD
jgi:hypothetical protein